MKAVIEPNQERLCNSAGIAVDEKVFIAKNIATQNKKGFRYSRKPFNYVSPIGLFSNQDVLKINELSEIFHLVRTGMANTTTVQFL